MEAKEFDIEFPRGDTPPFEFTLELEDGELLEDVDEIYFTMKKSYSTSEMILQKRLSRGEINQEGNVFSFVFKHLETATLPYGNYVYDVQIMLGEYVKTIIMGQITLTNESTFLENE